jgi:hypothetical protein
VGFEKGVDDVGPELLKYLLTFGSAQAFKEFDRHGLGGPLGNHLGEVIKTPAAFLGFQARLERGLGFLADQELRRRLSFSHQLWRLGSWRHAQMCSAIKSG